MKSQSGEDTVIFTLDRAKFFKQRLLRNWRKENVIEQLFTLHNLGKQQQRTSSRNFCLITILFEQIFSEKLCVS